MPAGRQAFSPVARTAGEKPSAMGRGGRVSGSGKGPRREAEGPELGHPETRLPSFSSFLTL